jgi:hypothetical protein
MNIYIYELVSYLVMYQTSYNTLFKLGKEKHSNRTCSLNFDRFISDLAITEVSAWSFLYAFTRLKKATNLV